MFFCSYNIWSVKGCNQDLLFYAVLQRERKVSVLLGIIVLENGMHCYTDNLLVD